MTILRDLDLYRADHPMRVAGALTRDLDNEVTINQFTRAARALIRDYNERDEATPAAARDRSARLTRAYDAAAAAARRLAHTHPEIAADLYRLFVADNGAYQTLRREATTSPERQAITCLRWALYRGMRRAGGSK